MEKNISPTMVFALTGSSFFFGWGMAIIIFHYNDKAKLKGSFTKAETRKLLEYPLEIKNELSSRVRTFFGDEGFHRLEESFVVVVGLGGVGSHCANMLVRSGVGRIRLIDFDQVSLSSLNRHALAEISDVGLPKVETMRRHLQNIVPWCQVEAYQEMFKMEDAERLLLRNGTPNFVIDCIDDVNTKAELIVFCLKNNLEVITSMGAGGKADPTRLRISALSDCINDPLASKIKWKLKKHGVSADDVVSIFSVEKPICELLPLTEEQKANPQDFGIVDYLRIRVIPVLGTSPSIFGHSLASYVLCKIAGRLYTPETCERMSKNLKHKMRQVFKNNEVKRFQTDKEIDIDDEDIEFIVQQMWNSRCAVTNRRFGGHIILTLTRWRADKPPVASNLVLMMQDQAELLHTCGHAAFSPAIVQKIEQRLLWAAKVLMDDEIFPTPSNAVKPNRKNDYTQKFLLGGTIVAIFGLLLAGSSIRNFRI